MNVPPPTPTDRVGSADANCAGRCHTVSLTSGSPTRGDAMKVLVATNETQGMFEDDYC
ncbi:MAG: hypothetical protein ACI9C1_002898, partial [Candidatus Aldehydirespiratoraceae bacterium]